MLAMPLNQILRWVAPLVLLLLLPAGPLLADEREDRRRERDRARAEAAEEVRHRLTEEERARMRAVRAELQAAQESYQQAMRQMVEIRRQLEQEHIEQRRMVRYATRAGIGVIVQTEPDPEVDRVGARIVAITPGGAAEEAGLEAGDIIVGFQGKALPTQAQHGRVPRSEPAVWLINRARKLQAGEPVAVEILRGSRKRTVRMEARPIRPRGLEFAPQWVVTPDLTSHISGVWISEALPRLVGELELLEMVELNPDLGEYFGTESGVLVVQAPEGGLFKMKGGDVLIRVGEREARTPEQAVRVLRSVGPGEPVVLHVIRKGSRITLKTEVPAVNGND